MDFHLGIKSDPIEYRYSYEWLFEVMHDAGIRFLQLGSFFELYSVDETYFQELRELAERNNILIKSCFTAHRELGGFFTGNRLLEKAAFNNYLQFIRIASILGAEFIGSNPGAVYRDRMDLKDEGIRCYLENMRLMMSYARQKGLRGLTLEPMSCSAEPPSFPEEIDQMMEELSRFHKSEPDTTVPVYICGDTSHGIADQSGKVAVPHDTLFEHQIPYMAEFHIKNTDTIFHSTFGFTDDEIGKGVVNLDWLAGIIKANAEKFPVKDLVGYLEIGGPKLGRDYTDHKLREMLTGSLINIRKRMEATLPVD
jgi:ribulose-phosphate 3-epimerase